MACVSRLGRRGSDRIRGLKLQATRLQAIEDLLLLARRELRPERDLVEITIAAPAQSDHGIELAHLDAGRKGISSHRPIDTVERG